MSTKIKNRPAKINNYSTKKSTPERSEKRSKTDYAAKLETLRRKTIRSEKYGASK